MNYSITHTTKYKYSDSVPVCHNIAHLRPRNLPTQSCDKFRLLVHPEPFDIYHHEDSFGNPVTYFSIEQAHLTLNVTAKSVIAVTPVQPSRTSTLWEQVITSLRSHPTEAIRRAYEFSFPSARTVAFDGLKEYASASFTDGRTIFEASKDLTARIHADFSYDPRSTDVSTPIQQVFAQRRGVCQDFAHFQIACFRAMGLAARYVSGYLRTYPPPGQPRLVGADASHAWVSVYCGEVGWIDFDPTNDCVPSTDHITLAWGRDYNDVCPIRGVILGGGQHQLEVSVDVCPLDAEQSQSQQQSQQ